MLEHMCMKGPLINGKVVSAADLSLGPKLYHLEISLGHYKNWSVPDSLTYVKSYMKVCRSLTAYFESLFSIILNIFMHKIQSTLFHGRVTQFVLNF